MALQAVIETLFGAQVGECDDLGLIALAFDMGLAGTMATLAAFLLEFQLVVDCAFEVGIAVEVS